MSRSTLRWLLPFAVGTALATAAALVVPALSQAASTPSQSDRAKLRADLLSHRELAPWTSMARAALYGTGAHRPDESGGDEPGGPGFGTQSSAVAPSSGAAPAAAPSAGLPNVAVNNPAEDTHQVDQTTQSETTIAAAGSNVAVGFNDSQQSLLAFTAGANLTGYAYSTDGGAHFTDGGTLPNPQSFTNSGDPWMTTDRAGNMYYSTLTFGGDVGNLEIAVGKSVNGGKTWSTPVFASPNDPSSLYFGDKDAITSGRSPTAASADVLYDTWDDQVCDPASFTCVNGLPVAVSKNGGKSWKLHYADKLASDPESCSFSQYLGAQPIVNPADGTLYVAAEKFSITDPTCTGAANLVTSMVIFKSTDAGQTFDNGTTISKITPASPTGAIVLGPGEFVRTAEFPSLALLGGKLFVVWNDGRTGQSHVHLAESGDGGASWSNRQVTFGSLDEIQPALTGDSSGLHLAYYQRNADNTIDTIVGDSTDGVHFGASRVTSAAFPGVTTVPQFDPIIAFGYMGDYIAEVSVGGHLYFAWGDNRRSVVDFTFPQGRHDPDVFFAKR
jgi:hypothetical protein